MARPEKNDVDYFPFYCKEGASTNYIDEKYGNNGFAVWVKLLRLLAKTDFHYLDLSKKKTLMHVSSKCKVDEDFLLKFLKDLADLDEIDKNLLEKNIVYSDKFIESISDAYKKRNNDLMKKEEFIHLLVSLGVLNDEKNDNFDQKTDDNTQSILKYSILKESKENKIKVKETKQELVLPFISEDFITSWNVLTKEKKWIKKSSSALQASLEILSKETEQDAIQMIKNSIAGGWQGIFPLKNNQTNGIKQGQSNYHSNKADVAELVKQTRSMLNGNQSNNDGGGCQG